MDLGFSLMCVCPAFGQVSVKTHECPLPSVRDAALIITIMAVLPSLFVSAKSV